MPDKEFIMTREEFRNAVLERDGHQCVNCKSTHNLTAHHIIERRLWSDGGYHVDNGVSLCEWCHLEAERTQLTCSILRRKAGIKTVVLPDHLYDDYQYDKWGNIILPNETRLKGELFYDESVQKVLNEAYMLDRFCTYVKYPRTHHLPWSNPSKDDKVTPSLDKLSNREVVVTLKLDGEQTNMYYDFIHARSLEFITGEDRGRVKAIWGQCRWDIPEGWRVCGENVYAKHSIHYKNLDSYFYVFSIWNEKNECLSWDKTIEWAELLGLKTVPVLYEGPFDEEKIKDLYQEEYDGNTMEGYVVRPKDMFTYGEFRHVVAKFVRPNHVTTDSHWRHKAIVPNEVKTS